MCCHKELESHTHSDVPPRKVLIPYDGGVTVHETLDLDDTPDTNRATDVGGRLDADDPDATRLRRHQRPRSSGQFLQGGREHPCLHHGHGRQAVSVQDSPCWPPPPLTREPYANGSGATRSTASRSSTTSETWALTSP